MNKRIEKHNESADKWTMNYCCQLTTANKHAPAAVARMYAAVYVLYVLYLQCWLQRNCC